MEYSLLKSITPHLPYLTAHSPYVRLTAYPAKDLVNPCIGQVTRLYDFYVPLLSHNYPFQIKKIGDNDKTSQEGFGNVASDASDEINDHERAETEAENNLENKVVDEKLLDQNKEIPSGILDSFQHPKIKLGKEVIRQTTLKMPSKIKKSFKAHKFNVV